MKFRPLPGLTVATLIAFAILAALGTWQLQRRIEKHALLDQIRTRETLAPAPIELLLPVGNYAAFRKATAFGNFANDQEIFVSHARLDGGPTRLGFRVLTPFALGSGGTILVDRGWIPAGQKDIATRQAGQIEGPTEITGSLQRPSTRGYFTPDPDIRQRLFFSRDASVIATSLGMTLRSHLIFELATGPKGGPEPIPSHADIPDNHLNYALTWYSLAFVLVVLYLRYHFTIGRLKFRP